MVSLSQVEENMEIKFKKKHQGAAFMAPVESILLYGKDIEKTRTYIKAIEKKLDGCLPKCYVWYLICLGWKLTNRELYGNLPPVSSKVGFRRLKLSRPLC